MANGAPAQESVDEPMDAPAGGEPVEREDAANNEVVDEITVVAPRSIPNLKSDIIRVERRMYSLYNEMNTDRMYDIHCRLEKVYASNRKERICLPAFEHGVMEEAWNDLSTWTGANMPEAELRRHREVLREKLITFANENPELGAAIRERAKLQRDLNAAEALMRQAKKED